MTLITTHFDYLTNIFSTCSDAQTHKWLALDSAGTSAKSFSFQRPVTLELINVDQPSIVTILVDHSSTVLSM